MKRNVSVVRFKFRCNILISGRIIKEMPGSVASGKQCSKSPRCNTSNQPAHYSVDAGSKVAGAWSRPLIPPPPSSASVQIKGKHNYTNNLA